MTEDKKEGVYAIQMIVDYGAGKQLQIVGNLPNNASLQDFNNELDKLRKATHRQQQFVWLKEREEKLLSSKKMLQITETLIDEFDKGVEKEMEALNKAPAHSTGKERTQISAAKENLRQQANNFRQQKEVEIAKIKGEIGLHELMVGNAKKEIAEIDGAENDNESP